MFERLAQEIRDAEVPPADGEALVELIALRDRLEAKIAEAAGTFDAGGLWDLDGATSMTAWLRHHAAMSSRDAVRTAAAGRRVRSLPVLAAAWRAGDLSTGQARAVVAVLDDRTEAVFADQEAEMVPLLTRLSVGQTVRAMAHWKARAEAVLDQDDGSPPREPQRSLHLSRTLGGRVALDADLDPLGSVVDTALRLATTDDTDGEPARTPARRRADALVDLCRHFLDHQTHRRGGRHRPHLNVVVDLDDLEAGRGGQVVGGGRIDGPDLGALLCDSALHRVVMAGPSAVLDYGCAVRTTPATLFNALVVRDEHCRWPGCDRPPPWCDSHHVLWVEHGGPTCLENLARVCRRHHTRLHHPGWHAKLLPDGTFEVCDPAGRTRTSAPPRAGPRPQSSSSTSRS